MNNISDPLTHNIIGCAMKVHNTLGNGFQEVIYQRALAIEMTKQGARVEVTSHCLSFPVKRRDSVRAVAGNLFLMWLRPIHPRHHPGPGPG